MPARVETADVQEITACKNNYDVQIEVAHQIVESRLSGCGLSEITLAMIEKYLAAHLAHAVQNQIVAEKNGSFSVTYAAMTGDGLRSTGYGRVALLLDTCNRLAASELKQAYLVVPT